ncbi:MAG: V-type ATPase subunit, partial [Firmicutes bacterium]|nr:V-type ATPase subunit [Bacillota bacterium]
MADNKIYPYAVARVRMFERRMLDGKTLYQMAEAHAPEDALRVLFEAGYGDANTDTIHTFESMLARELEKSYAETIELLPGEDFLNVFLYKNDYHNLKVLLKSEISGADPEPYLIDAGTVKVERLRESLLNRSYEMLPSLMKGAILEAQDIYSKTQSGQMIDITMDRYAFKSMVQTANESKNVFIITYMQRICDVTNLKSLMRVRNMKKGFEMFETVFVDGGLLGINTFKAAFASD